MNRRKCEKSPKQDLTCFGVFGIGYCLIDLMCASLGRIPCLFAVYPKKSAVSYANLHFVKFNCSPNSGVKLRLVFLDVLQMCLWRLLCRPCKQ